MSQNAGPSVPSSLTPIRCTTAGTSIVPLEPLARRLEAWLLLPSPSRWLTCTIRLGYAIQFTRRPPKSAAFSRLRWQLGTLLSCARRLLSSWQGCNRAGPSSRDEAGVLQPLFHRTQERRWSSTNPGLRLLNRALHRLPFKMLTHRRMIKCIQPRDWFAAIDLKDAYFHVSILPRHRPFLRFASEGRAWQYREPRALMPADSGRYPPPAVAIPSPPAGCLVPGLPLHQTRRSREITPFTGKANPPTAAPSIHAAVRGESQPADRGSLNSRRRPRLTQPAVRGRSSPPSADHPGPPIAGDIRRRLWLFQARRLVA